MNKSNNKFITELRARGLQITHQEAQNLMNIAIAEHDKAVVMPVLKREKIAHYAILALSYADSLNELMYGIDDTKFSREFKLAIELKTIRFGTGKPEWGAEANKKYFVLYLGKIINTKNIDK